MKRSGYIVAAGLAAIVLAPAVGVAGIMGFGDFSTFAVNQVDSGSPPTTPAAGSIELTNGNAEGRSIFADAKQNISQFTASFTYQTTNTRNFGGDTGATFVLQNDARGASAEPASGFSNFGFGGIGNSVGVIFDLNDNATGLFTNGSVGSGEASVNPVNLESGDPINVQFAYSGSMLSESLVDSVTSASYSKTYLGLTSFSTTVGSSSAYVGLAAGGQDSADQFFSNFVFTPLVPEPTNFALLAVGTFTLVRRRH